MAAIALGFGMAFTGLTANLPYASNLASGGANDFSPADARFEQAGLLAENAVFSPREFFVHRGNITEITVENKDAEFHTFTYEARGTTFNHDVLAGTTLKFLVLLDEPGVVKFRCKPHRGGYEESDGMTGRIIVT